MAAIATAVVSVVLLTVAGRQVVQCRLGDWGVFIRGVLVAGCSEPLRGAVQ